MQKFPAIFLFFVTSLCAPLLKAMDQESFIYTDPGLFDEKKYGKNEMEKFIAFKEILFNQSSENDALTTAIDAINQLVTDDFAPAVVFRAQLALAAGDFEYAHELNYKAVQLGHPQGKLELALSILHDAVQPVHTGKNEFYQHFAVKSLLDKFYSSKGSAYHITPEVVARINNAYRLRYEAESESEGREDLKSHVSRVIVPESPQAISRGKQDCQKDAQDSERLIEESKEDLTVVVQKTDKTNEQEESKKKQQRHLPDKIEKGRQTEMLQQPETESVVNGEAKNTDTSLFEEIKQAALNSKSQVLKGICKALQDGLDEHVFSEFVASGAQQALEGYVKKAWSGEHSYLYARMLEASGKQAEAASYFEKAAKRYKPAAWYCAFLKLKCEQQVESGIADVSQLKNAVMPEGDEELQKNILLVLERLERLAQHQGQAAYLLSQLYSEGLIVEKNAKKSVTFFELALQLKDKQALIDRLMILKDAKDVNQAQCEDMKNLVVALLDKNDVALRDLVLETIKKLLEKGILPISICYRLIIDVLPYDTALGVKLLQYCEEKLSQRTEGSNVDKNADLLLIKTSGAYEKLVAASHQCGEISCALAGVCMSRARKGAGLNKDVVGDYLQAVTYLEQAKALGSGDAQMSKEQAMLELAHYLYKKKKYQQSAQYLKELVKQGYYPAVILYARMLMSGHLELNGTNSLAHGISLCRKVLTAINVDESLRGEARSLVTFGLQCQLEETKGTAPGAAVREELLSLLSTKAKKAFSMKLAQDMSYYTPEEVYEFAHQDGPLKGVALYALGCSALKDGKYTDAATTHFQAAVDQGNLAGYTQLIRICIQEASEESFSNLFKLVDLFRVNVLSNAQTCSLYATSIETMLQMLEDLGKKGMARAWYKVADFLFVQFELTKQAPLLERAIEAWFAAEQLTIQEFKEKAQAVASNMLPGITFENVIFGLPIIAHAEKIVNSHQVPQLAIAVARVHKRRFEEKAAYSQVKHVHLLSALEFYEKALKQGFSDHTILSECAQLYAKKAQDFAANMDEQLNYVQKAIEKDARCIPALRMHAEILFARQDGNPKLHVQRALKDLQVAKEAGSEEATFSLGRIYLDGKQVGAYKVQPNLKKALEILEPLARNGSIQAQIDLGGYYLNEGMRDKAMEWFALADQQGDKRGTLGLGISYYSQGLRTEEEGVRNARFAQAATYFERLQGGPELAARQAELHLAKMHICGLGVEVSLEKGLEYFERFLECGEKLGIVNPQIKQLKILDDLATLEKNSQLRPRVKCALGGYWAIYAVIEQESENKIFYFKKTIDYYECAVKEETISEENKIKAYASLAQSYFELMKHAKMCQPKLLEINKVPLAQNCLTQATSYLLRVISLGHEDGKPRYDFIPGFLEKFNTKVLMLNISWSHDPALGALLARISTIIDNGMKTLWAKA